MTGITQVRFCGQARLGNQLLPWALMLQVVRPTPGEVKTFAPALSPVGMRLRPDPTRAVRAYQTGLLEDLVHMGVNSSMN
jgi:hypothetical protein